MHFPMLCNWLTIKLSNSGKAYEIINELVDNEVFITTEYGDDAYIKYITSLDGKTDYRTTNIYSPRVATAIINELNSFGLLRESRWLCRSLSCVAYSLIIPKHQSTNSFLPRIINFFLWTLFLPVLIYGLICFSSVILYLNNVSTAGIICGYILGIIFHEAGHAIATLAYGGRVFEFGLQTTYCILGAYTLLKNDNLTLLKKVQVHAAGVQSNLFLAGLSLILAKHRIEYVDLFYCIGATNITLALINLCNISGNDGSNILSSLLGVEGSIIDTAITSIFDSSRRSYLLSCGSAGRTTLCAYCIILFMQVATPALLIANILGVIAWFD